MDLTQPDNAKELLAKSKDYAEWTASVDLIKAANGGEIPGWLWAVVNGLNRKSEADAVYGK